MTGWRFVATKTELRSTVFWNLILYYFRDYHNSLIKLPNLIGEYYVLYSIDTELHYAKSYGLFFCS